MTSEESQAIVDFVTGADINEMDYSAMYNEYTHHHTDEYIGHGSTRKTQLPGAEQKTTFQ